MRNWILLLFVGIIFLLPFKFQTAINTPLAGAEIIVLLTVGIMGLVAIKNR